MSDGNLTFNHLRDAYNRVLLAGKLVYAVSKAVSEGHVIMVKETDWSYQYVIFHDEETARRIAAEASVELLHLRDAPMKPPPRPTGPLHIEPEELGFTLDWRTRWGLL